MLNYFKFIEEFSLYLFKWCSATKTLWQSRKASITLNSVPSPISTECLVLAHGWNEIHGHDCVSKAAKRNCGSSESQQRAIPCKQPELLFFFFLVNYLMWKLPQQQAGGGQCLPGFPPIFLIWCRSILFLPPSCTIMGFWYLCSD